MFLCMQKINFISNFFFEILQTHCKLTILGTLRMLDHPHQKSYYKFVGNFHAYLYPKIKFINRFFPKKLQRTSKLVILGNLGIPSHTPKMIASIWRNLWCLSAGKNSTSSFPFSLRYWKDIANLLFWVHWACLAMHTQNDTTNLLKTLIFIFMPKTNFILPFPSWDITF